MHYLKKSYGVTKCFSIKIKVALRPGHWFVGRFTEGFFKALGKGIATCALISNRLLEHRFSTRCLRIENPIGFTQLDLVLTFRLAVPYATL